MANRKEKKKKKVKMTEFFRKTIPIKKSNSLLVMILKIGVQNFKSWQKTRKNMEWTTIDVICNWINSQNASRFISVLIPQGKYSKDQLEVTQVVLIFIKN